MCSHYDEYIVDFVLFLNRLHPGSNAVFKPPAVCDEPISPDSAKQGGLIVAQSLSLLPSALFGGRSRDGVTLQAVASVASVLQQEMGDGVLPSSEPGSAASSHLAASHRFVESWNRDRADSQGFKLALNRFAAMPHEQFAATSLGHVPSSRPRRSSSATSSATTTTHMLGQKLKVGGGGFLGTFKRKLRDEDLPPTVDYRGTGADGGVKDQAFCGSCCELGSV